MRICRHASYDLLSRGCTAQAHLVPLANDHEGANSLHAHLVDLIAKHVCRQSEASHGPCTLTDNKIDRTHGKVLGL